MCGCGGGYDYKNRLEVYDAKPELDVVGVVGLFSLRWR